MRTHTLAALGFLALEAAASPLHADAVGTHAGAQFGTRIGTRVETHSKREIPQSHVLHDHHAGQQGKAWHKRSKLARRNVLPMRIGLKQRNLERGHDLLMSISNPLSKRYGQHMSGTEVIDLFAPGEDSVKAVTAWLVEAGISEDRISQSINKQWLQFDATVEEAEELLYTDYHVFEHKADGHQNIACEGYHIPAGVQEHVDYITPGTVLTPSNDLRRKRSAKNKKRDEIHQSTPRHAGADRRRWVSPDYEPFEPLPETAAKAISKHANSKATNNTSQCDQYILPECIREMYKIPKGETATKGNKLGIFEGLDQHYTQEDLDMYFQEVYPEIPQGTHPELRSVDGGVGPTKDLANAGVEANLDFEIAYPLVWPQQQVLFQVDDPYYEFNQTQPGSPYRGFLNNLFNAIDGSYCDYEAFGEKGNCDRPECLDPSYPDPNEGGYKGALMCGTYLPTNVISVSYGGSEIDLPYSYQQRQCSEIMKLGLQGVSVVISSGDSGVAGPPGDPTASGCIGPEEKTFNPDFPATCPYVLAVGSTVLPAGRKPQGAPETATTRFPSGGGFSNIYERPEYQTDNVGDYLSSAGLNFTGYEGGGKNYSNVGAGGGLYNAAGRGYPDVSAVGDNIIIFSGGQTGRVGGTSASAPVWGAVLTLINEARLTAGKKPVGFVHPVLYAHPEVFHDITEGSNPGCDTQGFPAREGWDPVSGLGTPVYPKLLELFMSLP